MKKLLKVVGILLGTMVLLLVVAVIVVPILLDPNDYKDQIADAVEEQTGRKLRIEGDIGLSVFPWLGVDLDGVELGNAAGFAGDYFARTQQVQVRVKLVPLIKKEVEMDTVRIEGLALNLARDETGKTNWDDLIQAGGKTPSTDSGPPAVAALAVGGIDLRGANISWNDALAGNKVSVRALSLQTGPVALDSPLTINVEFDLQSDQPSVSGHVTAAGEFSFDPDSQVAEAKDLFVEATLEGEAIPGGATDISLSGNATFDQLKQSFALAGLQLSVPNLNLNGIKADINASGNINGDLSSGLYRAQDFTVDGSLSGEAVPGDSLPFKVTTDLGLDLNAQTLVVESYKVASGALAASGKLSVDKLTDAPRFSGELAVEGFSPRAMLEQLGQSVPETADKTALSSFELEAKFAGSATDLTLEPFSAKLDDTLLKGRLAVENFASPAIRLTLAANSLDVDRYLPPKGAPAASPAAAAPAATGLPVETLRALDIDAQVAVGKVKVTGLNLNDVKATLKAKDGLIKLSPISAGLYGGSYSGNITVDASADEARIGVDEKLAGVRVGELLAALAIDTGDMDLSDAAGDVQIRANMSGDPAKQLYDLKGAFARANVTGKALPGGKLIASAAADLKVDVGKQTLDGRNVKLAVVNLKLPNGLTASGKVDAATLATSFSGNKVSASGVNVDLKELQLSPQAPKTNVKLSVAKLDTDLGKQTLTADGFDLAVLGLKASGRLAVAQMMDDPQVAGVLDVASFNPKQLLKVLGQPPIQTADPKALTAASMQTTFTASLNSVSLNPLSLKLDETKLDGTLDVADLATPNGIRFDLRATSINADRYLPPQAKGQAGTPGAAAAALPLDLLRGLDAAGTLKIGKLVLSNLQLTDINLKISGKGGVLEANPVNALLYGGTYAGNISVDARAKQAKLSVDEQLDRVHIGPLLRDLKGENRLSGRGGFRMKATATGNDTDQFKRTLNGQAALVLANGSVKGVDIVHTLCSGIAGLLGAQGSSGGETKFTDLTASANITNGLVANRDFQARSPLLRVGGGGTYNLVKDWVDYDVEASLVATCQGQGGLGLQEVGKLPPAGVHISGPLNNLKYDFDLAQMLTGIAGSGLGKQLGIDKLGEKIGLPGLVLPGTQQQPQSGQTQPQQQPQPAKPEDALKDLLEGFF